jgi:hypothetical protein
VIIGGIVVDPGHIVRGDVVVLPRVREAKQLNGAEDILRSEKQLRQFCAREMGIGR